MGLDKREVTLTRFNACAEDRLVNRVGAPRVLQGRLPGTGNGDGGTDLAKGHTDDLWQERR